MRISLTAAFRNNKDYAEAYRSCDLIFAVHGYSDEQIAEIKELFPGKVVFLKYCTVGKELLLYLTQGKKDGLHELLLQEFETIKASLPKNQEIELVHLDTIRYSQEPTKLTIYEDQPDSSVS